MKNDSDYVISLKKGNYKLVFSNQESYFCGYSFRIVNSAATFLPFISGKFSFGSVGGVEPEFTILNKWNKTIKYIYFDLYFYNSVGDLEYDIIGNYSSTKLRIVGPIKKHKYYWGSWYPVFYNGDVYSIKITKATVIFMDGTKKTINVNKRYYKW